MGNYDHHVVQEVDQKPIMKKKMMTMLKEERDEKALKLLHSRRYLSGPGSSPPRCTSKCGSCTPCKPVHVPVPPGTPVTAEYYPEAWRCKCGNKLYMPWIWCFRFFLLLFWVQCSSLSLTLVSLPTYFLNRMHSEAN